MKMLQNSQSEILLAKDKGYNSKWTPKSEKPNKHAKPAYYFNSVEPVDISQATSDTMAPSFTFRLRQTYTQTTVRNIAHETLYTVLHNKGRHHTHGDISVKSQPIF